MTLMRQICSYCGVHYGDKPGFGQSGDSHGICPECVEKEFPEYAERIKTKEEEKV